MIIQPSFGGCLHRDTGNDDKKKAPLGLLQGALRKGGGYLLSRVTSTIGVAGLNFPVRNGEGWTPRAMTALLFLYTSPGLLRRRRGVLRTLCLKNH